MLNLLMIPVNILLKGLYVYYYFMWFLGFIFPDTVLTYSQSVGVALCIGLFQGTSGGFSDLAGLYREYKNDNDIKNCYYLLVFIMHPVVILGTGYIVHLFIG